MKISKVAIVGLGSIGRRHLRIINELYRNVEIIIVRSGKGKDWPEISLAKKVVYSMDEAISEGIQAAVISSPASIHIEQAIYLANNGIHLLIEKPLSNNLNNLDKLKKIVENKCIVATVGYALRYDPSAIKFKSFIDRSDIGKILHVRIECGSYLPGWRVDQNYKNTVSSSTELGGGVLLELSHELDYMNWFFGKQKSLFATIINSKSLGINVEDQVDILLKSCDGYPSIIQIDFCRQFPRRICEIQTTYGQLVWDFMERSVKWMPINKKEELYKYDVKKDEMYINQITKFFDCIDNRNAPDVTIDDGIAVMNMIDLCIQSDTTGKRVKI
jgi:predicted dehydrogenase